jgi:hypothetical protein
VLDPQLIAFVRQSLRSLWALEVLLLVRRRAPNAASHDDIVRELRATPFLIRRIVDQLAEERLIVVEGDKAVRFAPSSPEQIALCDLLEVASRDRPIALRDAIVSLPSDKLQNFADAFRLKDKDR